MSMKHEDHICRFNDGEQTCDCYDAGYEKGRESMREKILSVIKDYKEPRFAFQEADALRSHLVKIGNFVKSLPPKQ